MNYHRNTTSETSQPYSLNPQHAADYRSWAFISLGSNLRSRFGSPLQTVLQAIDALRRLSSEPVMISSLWQTDPLDCPEGSQSFVNGIVALVPREAESASSLLWSLQKIENDYGRRRTGVINEPRSLDLDLIGFRGQTLTQADLSIPHPQAHQRQFVLQPLAEIAPDLILPGQERTVQELHQELSCQADQGRLQYIGRPRA